MCIYIFVAVDAVFQKVNGIYELVSLLISLEINPTSILIAKAVLRKFTCIMSVQIQKKTKKKKDEEKEKENEGGEEEKPAEKQVSKKKVTVFTVSLGVPSVTKNLEIILTQDRLISVMLV